MTVLQVTDIFTKMKPYIIDLIGDTVVEGAPSPHALDSVHHSGTLGDTQAPQFLKTDGTRTLTGNLAVSDTITIDGVDISVHASSVSAHHAAFVGLEDDALSDADPDGSYRIKIAGGAGLSTLTSTNTITVSLDTPGTLTYTTSNSATSPHTHAITNDYNFPSSQTILSVDGSGRLGVKYLGVGSTLPDMTNWAVYINTGKVYIGDRTTITRTYAASWYDVMLGVTMNNSTPSIWTYGIYGRNQYSGTSVHSNRTHAIYGHIYNPSGYQMENCYAFYGSGTVENAGSRIQQLVGLEVQHVITTPATAAEVYGFRYYDYTGGGTVGSQYGIRIHDLTQASTNYAIQTGKGKVQLGDVTTITNWQAIPSWSGLLVVNGYAYADDEYYSIYAYTRLNYTGAFTHRATGVYSYTHASTAYNVTTMEAFRAYSYLDGNATATTVTHLQVGEGLVPTGSSIVTMHGIKIGNISKSGSGTVTNLYGIYIDSLTSGSTNNYAIRTNLGKVYFGDQTYVYVQKSLISYAAGLNVETRQTANAFYYGINVDTRYSGSTAFTNNMIGVNSQIWLDSGYNHDYVRSFLATFAMYNGSSITYAYGFSIGYGGWIDTGSTISNYYYLHVQQYAGTGTVENQYGLYISGITAGTGVNYAIYTNQGLVRFGGAVSIWSTTTDQFAVYYDYGNYFRVNVGNTGNTTFSTNTSASGGNLSISPVGDVLFNPTGNEVYPETNYDLDLGRINKKWKSLFVAELWVETLVAQETIATIGGRILVGPTTTLTSDLAAGATTIYVKHNEMASGDRVYMEKEGQVEFMSIDSGPSGTGPYSYTVTRNLDGTGSDDWIAGDAVFNTGTTGEGFIDLYSVHGVKAGTEYGPTIVGNLRLSSTFNDWAEAWAIGNLNGIYGISSDTMGVGLGVYSATSEYATFLPTGITFYGDGNVKIASWLGTTLSLGTDSGYHTDITTADIRFKNNTVEMASWIGSTIVLGVATTENVRITSTAVELRNGSTVNASLTNNEFQMGQTSGSRITVTPTAITFLEGASQYGSLTSSIWTLGTASENVAISSTGVTITRGAGSEVFSATASGISITESYTVRTTIASGVITLGATAGQRVIIDDTNGIRMIRYSSGDYVVANIKINGDFFIGSAVGTPATTYFTYFNVAQTYNSEATIGAGDLMLGRNDSGYANMYWDSSAGQLKFRGNKTDQVVIDTDGYLTVGAGKIRMGSTGIRMQALTGWDEGASITFENASYGDISGKLYGISNDLGSYGVHEVHLEAYGEDTSPGNNFYRPLLYLYTYDSTPTLLAGMSFINGFVTIYSALTSSIGFPALEIQVDFTSMYHLHVDQVSGEDDFFITLSNSDVSHAMTTLYTDAQVTGILRKLSSTSGGLRMDGVTEATNALQLQGSATTVDTTRSSSANAAILLVGAKDNASGGVGSVGAGGNLVAISDYTTRVWIVGASGNSWQSGHAKANHLRIVDGVTAPSTDSGYAEIYVDTADGDLKVKFGNGFVATIAADS